MYYGYEEPPSKTDYKSYLHTSFVNKHLETHQASQVIIAVWVFFPKADGVPVALLRFLKLLKAVLNNTQVHPSSSKVGPAQIKTQYTLYLKLFSFGTNEMKWLSVLVVCSFALDNILNRHSFRQKLLCLNQFISLL